MLEYAKDAFETETPWIGWQHRRIGAEEWIRCTFHPTWDEGHEYRRKPKTIILNGIKLPAPYRGEMGKGQQYFSASTSGSTPWWNDEVDNRRRESGQLHLTKEAADLWRDAIKKITS
jgi:hypothetical protein